MNEEFSLKIDDEEIVFADLTNREFLEAVIVCKSGNIFLFDLEKGTKSFVAKLTFDSVPNLVNDFNLMEILASLDPNDLTELLKNQPKEIESLESLAEKNQEFVSSLPLNLKLYSFENYICLVQEKDVNGVVLNLENPYFQKKLKRGDYHVEQCSFPIAFYKKEDQTFLIHGTDWNRLDIACLETDELLTDRIVDYETDSNYFDYFHSSLLVSPDAKHFTSNGWHWHPVGQIYCFSIEEFLRDFESSHQRIVVSDEDCYDLDWEQPLCWIDNRTLAVGFNRKIVDGEQNEYPSEILFYDIIEDKVMKRIDFNGFSVSSDGNVEGKLFFDSRKKHFVCLSKKLGLLITDINGKEVFANQDIKEYKYSEKHKIFYEIKNNEQTITLVNFHEN